MRTVGRGNELRGVEEEEPREDRGRGEEELGSERDEEGESVACYEEELEEEGLQHYVEGEEGELCKVFGEGGGEREISSCFIRIRLRLSMMKAREEARIGSGDFRGILDPTSKG